MLQRDITQVYYMYIFLNYLNIKAYFCGFHCNENSLVIGKCWPENTVYKTLNLALGPKFSKYVSSHELSSCEKLFKCHCADIMSAVCSLLYMRNLTLQTQLSIVL